MKVLNRNTESEGQGERAQSVTTPLRQALNEGQARHDERQARKAGAVWVRSLDGYVISKADLAKLTRGEVNQ